MALPKTPININFAQGMDQKSDPKQIRPGKFLSLVNRVFTKGGLLQKRNGYDALSKSVDSPFNTINDSKIPGVMLLGRSLGDYANELILMDGTSLYSYASTPDSWVYKGRAELNAIESQSIYQDQYNNICADSALNSTLGINLFAWESWTSNPYGNGTYRHIAFSVVDGETGLTMYNSAQISATRPKCVSVGSNLYITYHETATNNLKARPITDNSVGNEITFVSNVDSTNPNYDIIVVGSTIYVAYNGSGSTVKVASFNSSFSAVASVSKAETATNCICLFNDTSNNIWVGYNNGSATKGFVMDSALSVTVLAPTTIDASGTAAGVKNITGVYGTLTSPTQSMFFYDQPGNPVPGQSSGITVDSSFTQPAVNATVGITVSDDFTLGGQIVYIPTGGYYFVTAWTGTSVTVKNLGFSGNAAPAATVAATPQIVYPTAGYQNSVVNWGVLMVSGPSSGSGTFCKSVALASRAYKVNSVPHVTMVHDSTLQPTFFTGAYYNISTLSGTTAAIVGKIAASEATGVPFRSILPSVNTVATGIFQCALNKRSVAIQQTSSNSSNIFYLNGVFSAGIDYVTNEIVSNDIGNNLQIGSGTLLMYDGKSTVEQGFHLYPETVTITNGGTGALSAGLYGYKAVYQWIDNKGQIHRSAPSPNVSIDAGAGTENTIIIPTLRVTEKTSVTIELYRTAANGSVYYRIDTMFSTFPINNSTTANTVTVTEGRADADIIGNEQLYTAQEVENIGPPAVDFVADYKNRSIIIHSENPFGYGYSKQVIDGSPVEYSDLFFQSTGTVPGALVGASKLDDKLILFFPQSLYYQTGTGPAPNGTNNDFSEPQFITSDAGLEDPRSIVTTPSGLMFKSSKGIYLLDRSLQTRYIGAAVEDYNQYTVTGARLIPDQNQVRFTLSNGMALLYDYYWTDEQGVGQWAVFSNISAVSDTIFDGVHTYLTSTGQVYKETPGVYLDGATSVDTSFVTAWINVAGLQGYERAYFFYFLAKYISAHTLTVNIYFDYDETIAQTVTITPESSDLEQWRVFLSQQKCEAFKIEVIESSSGSGAGFTMSGLDLIVGVKSGWPRLRAAKSAG